jgi:hypothetical protein
LLGFCFLLTPSLEAQKIVSLLIPSNRNRKRTKAALPLMCRFLFCSNRYVCGEGNECNADFECECGIDGAPRYEQISWQILPGEYDKCFAETSNRVWYDDDDTANLCFEGGDSTTASMTSHQAILICLTAGLKTQQDVITIAKLSCMFFARSLHLNRLTYLWLCRRRFK